MQRTPFFRITQYQTARTILVVRVILDDKSFIRYRFLDFRYTNASYDALINRVFREFILSGPYLRCYSNNVVHIRMLKLSKPTYIIHLQPILF